MNACTMDSRVTSAIGIGLGLLGILAWISLAPYSAPTAYEWGSAFLLMVLAALVLLITASLFTLVGLYWLRFVPVLRWLRPLAIMGVIAGLVGILAWLPWAYAPPLCMSTEPIAPGTCPSVPSAAEGWTVFVALILMINISAFLLFKSSRKSPRPSP